MCRVAAYLGPPRALSALLYDPPHSLDRQSYAPREMLQGYVNVDGTGVAWWPPGTDAAGPDGPDEPEPLRYVSERPPWSDPNLPGLASRLEATAMLAAVRSATPGVPFGAAAVAPFTHGRLAGMHNGWLGRLREGTGRELASRLPDALHGRLEVFSDSLLVFLTVVKHLDADPEAGLAGALRATVGEVVKVCADAGAEATLNVVVADGERIVAVRTAHDMPANNPLVWAQGGPRWAGGTVLASEALDEESEWQVLDDDHMVEITRDGLVVSRIEPA